MKNMERDIILDTKKIDMVSLELDEDFHDGFKIETFDYDVYILTPDITEGHTRLTTQNDLPSFTNSSIKDIKYIYHNDEEKVLEYISDEYNVFYGHAEYVKDIIITTTFGDIILHLRKLHSDPEHYLEDSFIIWIDKK